MKLIGWRPTLELLREVEHYKKIKADLDAFDGDRRGIISALSAAESRVVQALQFNPEGFEDDDQDHDVIELCCRVIVKCVDAASR